MTHVTYKQWPNLCDYYDRPQIQTHWPRGQAAQYSIAPTINILFGPTDHPDPRHPQWKMSQPLWFANERGWSYRTTKWNASGQEVVLELKMASTQRNRYWDYSIDAWLWTPDYEPLGHGQYVKRYAGLYYTDSYVWVWPRWFRMEYFYQPFFETEIEIFPTAPKHAWPEVPEQL